MEQLQINVDDAPGNPHEKTVGDQLWLKFNPNDAQKVCLYRHDLLLKSADLKDRAAKRLFVVEAVNQGANQTLLSRALKISRQSIHNYMEIHRHFGLEGLINNYVPSRSKNLQKQREINREKRLCGNKARQLEQIRREERQNAGFQIPLTLADQRAEVLEDDQAFARCHDWQPTRYAGIICYLITLIHLNDWMNLVMAFFGKRYQVFMAFMLMVANGVRSIEQIKNLHLAEAGRLLGMGVFPNRAQLRQWLHEICQKNLSGPLLQAYFLQQVRCGVVGVWLWFADGHLLPYTGETRVHYAYNTQRQLAVPGRTNLVTCDGSGRVVDFQIQEGKGDLRQYLVTLGRKWQAEINPTPVMVFDREGYGAAFFHEMNQAGVQFVCWEKHIDTQTLGALSLDCFGEHLEVNGKTYGIFEGEKQFKIDDKNGFTLRRIYIHNHSSGRRTCVLSNAAPDRLSSKDCTRAILSRWGASENTFKHIAARHPLNYQPGYAFVPSDHQSIVNPEIKPLRRQVQSEQKGLAKLYKKLAKSNQMLNKNGDIRENSVHQRLKDQIREKEELIARIALQIKQLPERVDVSGLEDYTCFQKICNESKNLFDFVTSSVWNARKQMTEWLLPLYGNANDCVDLFYAITYCHGWIRCERDRVTVRIEPLQQPARRAAQQQFCRKLSELRVSLPNGKLIVVEVGGPPAEIK